MKFNPNGWIQCYYEKVEENQLRLLFSFAFPSCEEAAERPSPDIDARSIRNKFLLFKLYPVCDIVSQQLRLRELLSL
jgi:hypothetical protein